MPRTPSAVEIGACAGSTRRTASAGRQAYSCQPPTPKTMSPGSKRGSSERTTSETVRPVITSPMPTGVAYDGPAFMRPRM